MDVPKLGPRTTRQRTAVVETLQAIDRFASAKSIHQELQARGEKVGLTTCLLYTSSEPTRRS